MASLAIILLSALSVIVIGFAAIIIEKRQRLAELRRDHRTIRWDEAMRRVREGRGAIVENGTPLPGRLWWIENPGAVDELARIDEVAERGLCVEAPPSQTRVKQIVSEEGLSDRYQRIDSNEHFIDLDWR